MHRRHGAFAAATFCCVTLLLPAQVLAQEASTPRQAAAPGTAAPAASAPTPRTQAAIVSPAHPTDSRGETVYEVQGKSQMQVPVVPGVFHAPRPLHVAPPEYPESMRRKQQDFDLTVEGVVTPAGDFIDATVLEEVREDVAASTLHAVSRYRFTPATLDGRPVAVLIRVNITYRIR